MKLAESSTVLLQIAGAPDPHYSLAAEGSGN